MPLQGQYCCLSGGTTVAPFEATLLLPCGHKYLPVSGRVCVRNLFLLNLLLRKTYVLYLHITLNTSMTMKRILAFSLALLASASLSLQAAADRIIQYAQLPRPAQTFLEKYFRAQTATRIAEDYDDREAMYEVTLSDGIEIDFNSQGQWKKVDGDRIPIPTAFIPAQILQDLQRRRPGDQIMEVEHNRRGYKLELSSGIEAHYTNQLRFSHYDD